MHQHLADSSLPLLREHFDGFNYGYRMRCDCGWAVSITGETYAREVSNDARVPCHHCGGSVHFGPAVALIRDEDDPTLDNDAVNRFAWYHTSTRPDWPSADHRVEAEAAARQAAEHFCLDAEYMVKLATTRALHLGTYEAAVENMLRRMHDQDGADKQFYLYCVRLQLDPERINEGYRDENAEEASQLTLSDLDAADVDAVRYLNVWEAAGSLSLAVRPECIAAVQRLPIPLEDLAVAMPPPLSRRLADLEVRAAELAQASAAAPHLSSRERWRMKSGKVPDPDRIVERAEALAEKGYQVWNEVDALLGEHHLLGVSPVVRGDFTDAVSSRRRDDTSSVLEFAAFFGALATLLARPQEVVDLLARQPWRTMT